ncbi:ATP-binding protein [Devosia nitrariae]|uniref:histidine kinase n=1 Tax=Devosia nitrariae TaxID=2071872 RepID=A0ABQ5W9J2_9HYPH|nr:ATP-binding protein [Devosia nitrariae]GLQ56512.1 two-component sensor histidine kinase [Devosia nitrariae]
MRELIRSWQAGLRHPWSWLGLASAILLLMTLGWGGAWATRVYLNESEARGQNTLGLAVAVLRGHLARFERLPQLLADHEDIKRLVTAPDDGAFVDQINHYLREVNGLLETSDIYVMLPDGNTVAASNFDTETSFVGGNFSYRPYFIDALAGGLGRFFGLGTTSLKRGYYFGAPIHTEAGISGVVVIKIDLDEMESSWRGGDYEVIVTDPEGIIFMTSETDWLFMSVPPLTEDLLARTAKTIRYANAELRDLPTSQQRYQDDHQLLIVEDGAPRKEFLMVSEEMDEAGWTVTVLLDTASARSQAAVTVVLAVLLIGLVALSAAIYLQRRAQLQERLHIERRAHEQLEHRVIERTRELAQVNAQLEAEIGERKATEATLRQTQSDLIQAGKLAALGQMSAALSHEFNQPLAAARNYADNAIVLVERGRIEDARDTMSRIAGLIDRMASISRHLRNFARKPNEKLASVDLELVTRETLEIIGWRIKDGSAELVIDLGPTPLWVKAGPVRLQQVLVNIIANAVDAVSQATDKRIDLVARRSASKVTITIRDRGAGIPAGLGERIFDPFFSTKGVGKGLGLGLSISYNIVKDFGGDLRVENHPDGGAIFIIELKAATPAASEAESMAEPAE